LHCFSRRERFALRAKIGQAVTELVHSPLLLILHTSTDGGRYPILQVGKQFSFQRTICGNEAYSQ
jgi:hypothetical protein